MNCPHCHKPINPAAMLAARRAKSMSKQARTDSARKAALTRWANSSTVKNKS